jgi:hypothetical protein
VDQWRYERSEERTEIDYSKLHERKLRFQFGYIVLPFVITMTILGIAVFHQEGPKQFASRQSVTVTDFAKPVSATSRGSWSFKQVLLKRLNQNPIATLVYCATPILGLTWAFFIESDQPILNSVLGVASGCVVGLALLEEEGPITRGGFTKRWLLQIAITLLGTVFAYFAIWITILVLCVAITQNIWKTITGRELG